MSPFLQENQRRAWIPLVGLVLGCYYVTVFAPLRERAEALDQPLRQAWKSLAGNLDQTNVSALDFNGITNALRETQQALAQLEQARKKAAPRLELGAELRKKMRAPFQLVEYENDRDKEVEELIQLAAQQQVILDPPVFAGFPEHTADTRQPNAHHSAANMPKMRTMSIDARNCRYRVVAACRLAR